jgi:hypothetical protein
MIRAYGSVEGTKGLEVVVVVVVWRMPSCACCQASCPAVGCCLVLEGQVLWCCLVFDSSMATGL